MNADVLRIIDANANRAREAMRVIEDYARFSLDDPSLSGAIKQLRHDFAAAMRPLISDAILHRDTPGDVGTSIKISSEQARSSAADVVTASCKRLGEALRTIEEYLKISDPARAAQLESLRYRFYELERNVSLTLKPAGRFAGTRLYILLTESLCKQPWLEVAKQSIAGGADAIQLREKDLEDRELLDRARTVMRLCHEHEVLCIINDRPDIAALANAHGVHLGQQDLPAREARKMLGNDAIIGVSTHSIDQAKQAVLDGADYIGVGPVFPSRTKPREFLPGLEFARQAAASVKIPTLGIAGITVENVDEVLATGVRAVAVSSAVISAEDPGKAARKLKCKLQALGNGCPKML